MVYDVPIPTIMGATKTVTCLGMEAICKNTSEEVDVSAAYSIFPDIPEGALDRPIGDVDLLLGQNCASLLAYGGAEHRVEELRASVQVGFLVDVTKKSNSILQHLMPRLTF